MDTEVMLTTFDNPFNPFDDFVSWFMFDIDHGYDTCGKIARIARWSEEFSTAEDKAETERAIDTIIDNDFLNIFEKVTRKVEAKETEEDNNDEESSND